MWLECTYRWNTGILRERLPEKFSVHRMMMQGKDVGDSYNRKRCGCLAINDSRVTLAHPLEDFLQYTGAVPEFPVSDFWQTSEEDQAREIEEWAIRRVVPVGDELSWKDVLLPSQRERKEAYNVQIEKLIRECKLLPGEAVLVDLDQNPAAGRGRMTTLSMAKRETFLPTLIQHQVLWNTETDSPLTALDHLKAHGWLVEEEECAFFGSCASWRADLISKTITHRQVISMMGDSWHIPLQGRWLMYLLSIMELRDNRLPRAPKCFKARASSTEPVCIVLGDSYEDDGASPETDELYESPSSMLSVAVHDSESEDS